jgi:ABC-type multidrug transport system permease subunit
MYITDVVWWGYTAFLVAAIGFMLWFARAVRQKEE